MTQITTHVLDTATGAPAAGLAITLLAAAGDSPFTEVARALTDDDGRVATFPEVGPGRARLVFATGTPFFDEVVVSFAVQDDRAHLHVPLLLSPYGYSVYRGS